MNTRRKYFNNLIKLSDLNDAMETNLLHLEKSILTYKSN